MITVRKNTKKEIDRVVRNFNQKIRRLEKKMQKAMLDIKKRFGKNAVMKANNLQNKATAKERNEQIGGHRA